MSLRGFFRKLDDLLGSCRNLLASCHNLLGSCHAKLQSGRCYPFLKHGFRSVGKCKKRELSTSSQFRRRASYCQVTISFWAACFLLLLLGTGSARALTPDLDSQALSDAGVVSGLGLFNV